MSSLVPHISPLAYNSSYIPGESLLTFTSIYGDGTDITFNQMQDLVNKKMRQAIMFGVRCGAATLTIIIMWMISKRKHTPIFIINQVSLFLIVIHSGLYFKYLLSSISSLAYSLTGFHQVVSRYDIYVYGAASIFQVLLVASIELSLVFQVKIMFAGITQKKVGYLALLISGCLGITTVAVYFTTAIKSMISVYQGVNTDYAKYFNIATILLSSSINFMTFILVVKLLFALRSRRFLGLKQFDSLHILLIMTCQSLLIPSVLFILAYSLDANSGTDVLTTVATLLVVLSLPLSSLWATSNNNVSNTKPMESDYSPEEGGFYPNFNNNGRWGAESVNSENKYSFKSSTKYSSDTLTSNVHMGSFDLENNSSSSEGSQQEKCSDRHYSNVYDDTEKTPVTVKEKSLTKNITETTECSLDIYTPDTLTDEATRNYWLSDSHNLNE
ncbi:similar to Saccharomyces cerevisiae YFL026W STE2 Receptor for alpha-factor pheromone [Maudiozyma barnettii]|uniref:Similar to Saccharomyces cerevisiae YFL026W STE2 Receptor for alpha-factor pheromone n=1 Tax=Maudiozyma barnettii TaxID=61262 RepID=A0A8H2ZFL5_9SACH|nr:alpha-factor pheromone receptor STE2 [Kazachstania barnettii]CAB4252469.1 similar to Saccharomyces cerevisiae YFL026W STE2 Receptor for alpha-factor pheromone [Kazachstania barnettii]CAD1779204.1 similar to Saccharomyces cerevisiae YFL026W STE2 Receptor for alpha-factor pheromone [Kazachstania barnettii]